MFKFTTVYKCLQRKCYDFLSLQYSVLIIIVSVLLFLLSVIHFGETWIEWSKRKYEAIFNSYSDNIAEKSFHHKLCHKVPVDVVYTWVNGSDPVFQGIMRESIRYMVRTPGLNETFYSRYEDLEELRYSLRSLEMFAPWVHHVFLVTNGQIPYWLDMDHPKLTVITHEQIFTNRSHLPTFSSPAIESHLHRIPGLSRYFIYFNDDIILGKTVWPEDFLTESDGYKIFITWNLPDCSPECTWSWVGDGSCDPPCNIEECSFDGGDCNQNSSYPKYEYHQMNGPLYDSELEREIEDEVKIVEEYYQSLKKTERRFEDGGYRKLLQWDSVVPDKNLTDKLKVNFLYDKFKKPINVKEEIVNLIKSNTTTNISDIVKATNLKYLEDNKAMQKIKKLKRNKFDLKNKTKIKSKSNMAEKREGMEAGNPQSKKLNTTSEKKPPKKKKPKRKLDMFAESLLHVNRLYNKAFGVTQRKVLAHMPHFVDKDILIEVHNRFAEEWTTTSSHQIRSTNDMQFAFAYYYYIVHSRLERSVADMFKEFDTDESGTWSDREIRTLLTRTYGVPLSYPVVLEFEDFIINCSKNYKTTIETSTRLYERYSDSKLPTVTLGLVENCPEVIEMLKQSFGTVPKFKYKLVPEKEQDAVFKMITSNVSQVVEGLDIVRSRPRKFICINNNMNEQHDKKENDIVRAVVQDFYLSLYPKRSTFELSSQYRNRFQHMRQLIEWKADRDVIYYSLLFILLIIGTSAFLIAFQTELVTCFWYYVGRERREYFLRFNTIHSSEKEVMQI